MPNPSLLTALARSFLAGEPAVAEIVARGERTLGRPWRWLQPLAERYVESTNGRIRPRLRDVVQFLLHDEGFARASRKYSRHLAIDQWLPGPQSMQPVAAAETWDIPAIDSAGALADWLWIEPAELDWFADLKGLNRQQKLSHYHYRVLTKQCGSIRLIEAPKPRLKKLQRQILAWILDKVPAHPAVHGFVKGRSIRTFVGPHIGRRVVLRLDLEDFFPSFAAARIQTFFRTAGYPESVADLLGGICTNAAPIRDARSLYSRPHLPQGAPTSPALANLCFYRVDCRLAGLTQAAGAAYTRYADDLAFSGDEAFDRSAERFSNHVAAILIDEGFRVHHRKTRIMRRGVRQHLAGLVANQRANIVRPDFDRLKATLTNCVRLGPESQNRDAHPRFREHLEGRVAFVETINPGKGQRLRRIFDQIQWK